MKDALQDLETFMVKARDMVRLAAELNEPLTASSTTATTSSPLASSPSTATLVPSTEPGEATFIRSSLSQLGLQMSNAPVTLDMMKDERKWFEELAWELTSVAGFSNGEGGDRDDERQGDPGFG
jgi:ESCRT-II complex subunit VPS36